ncbi:MAG: HDIG domain-containing metalloprotein [Armatimonadota bacterium]
MSRSRSARRSNGARTWTAVGSLTWIRIGLGLFAWAGAGLILLGYDLFPGRVSLRLGERSQVLIRAPRTAQYVDTDETEHLRREAEQQAAESPQYSAVPFAAADAEKRLDQDFEALAPAVSGASASRLSAKRVVSAVPSEALAWAKKAPPNRLETLRRTAGDVLRVVMAQEIREGAADVDGARFDAAKLASQKEKDPQAAAVLTALVSLEVAPNRRRDPEATKAAEGEARQRVQEVVRTIEADYPIIFPGERVTRQHLAMLQALGLAGPGLNHRRLISIGLLTALIVGLLGAQTYRWRRQVYERPKLLFLLSLLLVVALFVTNLLALSLPHPWMLVVPTAALIAAVLLGEAVALALALALSLMVGLMANGGLIATLLSLGSSAIALTCVAYLWPISRLRWIVGILAAANLLLVGATGFLQSQPLMSVLREAGLAAVLYSPGVAALSLGGIFLLQRPFGVTTHMSLLELSNPQHPLLRKMQADAPGTYYASVMVADLADAGAQAVGADALLARVGALYHDLGKLQRPTFFVENQGLLGTENVHDRLSSSLSGLVILSHVKDGVDMARRHRLAKEVVDIVEQHHGTTLVSFFYQRALSGDRPESVTEDHFRYPGPLPQTKEAAIVMLADSVQAASKSMPDPTPQRVQQLVSDIIRDRVVDGQFWECDLTFRDIATVEATMTRLLTALLCHTRIEYPEPAAAGPGA